MGKVEKDEYNNLISLSEFLETRSTWSMSLWGTSGIGKTRFCMTAPKPIFLMSFEPEGPRFALKECMKKGIIKDGEIFIDEVVKNALKDEHPAMVRTVAEQRAIYEYTQRQLSNIVEAEKEGTIIFDTNTEFYQILDEVEMEETIRKLKKEDKQLFPFHYRVSNKAMKSITDSIRKSGLNSIFTNQANSVYNAKGQKTKKWEYQGNNHLWKWVDVFFRLDAYFPTEEEREDGEKVERWAKIEKCRADMEMVGRTIADPTWDRVVKAIVPEE